MGTSMTSRAAFPTLAALALGASAMFACNEDVKYDNSTSDRPPTGIIRGTVVYSGPRPCSTKGHTLGGVLLLFFDARNPPPPTGTATSVVNFGYVPGDLLFTNEARFTGDSVDCPSGTTTATAPFTISPFPAAPYIVQAFYDRNGEFMPSLKIRNLPRLGDIGGGAIDTVDALAHAGDVNYQPLFQTLNVGAPSTDGGTTWTMPETGYVRDNVVVTVGQSLPLARPIFYPDGAQTVPASSATPQNAGGTPEYVPVVTMPQDVHILAPPAAQTPANAQRYQESFVNLRLNAGTPPEERALATRPDQPFHFQMDPTSPTLLNWRNGTQLIPEGQLPELFPSLAMTKLVDDPGAGGDPQLLAVQGDESAPTVVLQGITLFNDSILSTLLTPPPTSPANTTPVDHVTTLLRPAVVCLDPSKPGEKGILVTPYLTGQSADPSETGEKPLFDVDTILAHPTLARLASKVVQGCLPPGRYAMNLVYPSGQAWTTPNEAGSCSTAEGAVSGGEPGTCSASSTQRAVLRSQGTRAVLEILPATDPTHCQKFPVPAACLPKVSP
jgi:hypothetical protein